MFDADVAVVGAGAAGLAAARLLAEASLGVLVLEARDRVGGRAWTSRIGGSAFAELGAEFVHGNAPETYALAREAGLETLGDGEGESWAMGAGGELEREDDEFRPDAALFERVRSLRSDETVDRFFRRFEDDPAMSERIAAARAFVEGFDAADPAIASARGIADEWGSGVDSTSSRLREGYGPLMEYVRASILRAGATIALGTVVRRIAWQRGSVTTEVLENGKSSTIRTRAAIVTLPAGVLRQAAAAGVAFEPDLPLAKREALARIETGSVVKVALRFRTRFWERLHAGRYRDAAFLRPGRGPFRAYWTRFPVRDGVVSAWSGGPPAAALRELSTDDRIRLALDEFGRLFGERSRARADFVEGATHDWDRDPFSRGAYSFLAAGGETARTGLALPVGDTLFFAGEASSPDGQGGTVNGALATGERAAGEAIRAIRLRP